ncbi:thiosulfate oxidation carrier protein SoxY [Crenothrix polyspora]|uniref:Transmembrane proetin, twin-arginine translocation pathway signal n=1 Tax=Crenothrix polyspora TaxID=360316 RepID=A0A1R4H4N6_9GAMM|nr:thiosulfate oxidation carrier protein SoxY [Crenothrix polyspora]SJM91215.1 Transmembrane proetin, twin-arginine translocation pathway signal [Crenothrix polyspora]
MITNTRREFIKKATALSGYSMLSAAGLLNLRLAFAEAINFEALPMDLILQGVLKGKPVLDSDKIHIKISSSADNKIPVPITVETDLKDIKSISILVEQNTVPLVATFELSPALEPFVSTRLKLMRTSFVFVLLESNKIFYAAKQKVTVSESGCGA